MDIELVKPIKLTGKQLHHVEKLAKNIWGQIPEHLRGSIWWYKKPSEIMLDQEFDEVCKEALRIHDGTGGVQPKIFIVTQDAGGKFAIVLVSLDDPDFDDTKERWKLLGSVGMQIAERLYAENLRILSATIISEAWVSKGGDDQLKDEKGNPLLPSQQPNKQEAMIVANTTIEFKSSLVSYICLRDKNNNVRFNKTPELDSRKGDFQPQNLLVERFLYSYMAFNILVHITDETTFEKQWASLTKRNLV